MIGDVILHWSSEVHRSTEIGWILHPVSQGHGYATQAVRYLLRVGFDEFRHEGPVFTESLRVLIRATSGPSR